LLQSALNDLKKLLLQNGCPQGVITYNINDVLNRNKNKPNDPAVTVPKKDVIILLPYLGLHSNQAAKRLKSCVYKFYSCINLKIIFQNTRREAWEVVAFLATASQDRQSEVLNYC